MKILFAADVPPNPDSGAAGTEYQTIRALKNLGHEVVEIWSDDLPKRIRHGNLHYLLELPWAYRKVIARRCREQTFDVIHVNQPYAWLAARDHRKQRRPGVFINRSHGWEPRVREALKPWRETYQTPEWRFPRGIPGKPLQWSFQHYAQWCVAASDGIIVSCFEDREYIVTQYGKDPSRVACIAQAPASAFVKNPASPMTNDRLHNVMAAGNTVFVKAPHVIAAVYSRLARLHDGLSFTWCCPESSHAECYDLLEESARSRTTFVDWMPQEELVNLYDQHGIFIFPSFAEGFGKVFLEAMARGLCVIASNTGGMRDVIRPHETGWLVPTGDVEAFCAQVLALVQGDVADKISKAAAEQARLFSWERVAEETAAFYQCVIEQVSGRALERDRA